MPTPSVQATATVQPTAAATATPDAAIVKVNADIINVRSGPGTAYPVTGRLDGGATQKIVGKSEDGKWWQIATKEGNGWVAGELVTTGGPMQGVAVVKAAPPPTAAPQAQAAAAAIGGPAPRPSGGGSFGYGIQIDPWGDRGAAIGAVKNMGFNWVKFQLPWKDFEGQRGQRNWPDDIIGDLNGNGLNVLVSIVKAPDWARPGNTDRSVEGPPADPGTYASFVGEFAARYCGRVQAIEVWNEQNLDYEWGREPLDPARYVRLLAAAYWRDQARLPEHRRGQRRPDAHRRAATGGDGRFHLSGAHVSGRAGELCRRHRRASQRLQCRAGCTGRRPCL